MRQVLLIDREFGSGGSAIAETLAARLNWRLFDAALTQEIAWLARIPVEECRNREERTDPWLQRLINVLWRGTFDRNLAAPDLAILDTDRLVKIIEKVILSAAATTPCIIVGRGAPYFLRQRTDKIAVFLYASRECRFNRVLRRLGDAHKAIELVDSMDEDRKKFVKHYFGHDWPNRYLFDLMINTEIGDDNAVESILRLLEGINRSQVGLP